MNTSQPFRREPANPMIAEVIEWGFSQESFEKRPFQVHAFDDTNDSHKGPVWYLKKKGLASREEYPRDTRILRPTTDVTAIEHVQVGSKKFESKWEEAQTYPRLSH
eukprot:jgi/Galph1/4524/GphlegSOOS_G3166.1